MRGSFTKCLHDIIFDEIFYLSTCYEICIPETVFKCLIVLIISCFRWPKERKFWSTNMQTTSKTRLWKLSQTNVRMWIASFNDRIKQWWLTQPSSRFAHLEGGVKWGPTCPTFFLACSPLCSSCKYVWRAAPPLLIHSSPTKKGIQALGNAMHWPKHFKLKFTALFPNFFYWTFHFSEAPLTWIWPLAFSGKTTLIWRIWCNKYVQICVAYTFGENNINL